MFAVIFQVKPTELGKKEYLALAAELKKLLVKQNGCTSIERFQSLVEEGKILSLSFWQDEASIKNWRNMLDHRAAQKKGKYALFGSYRIRVAKVIRDYTDSDRDSAPQDSNQVIY